LQFLSDGRRAILAAGSCGGNVMQERVKAWMSGDPVSARAEDSALAAHDLMIRQGVRHLPIVDEARRVVGVLSIDDLRAALPIGASLRIPVPQTARPDVREWSVGDLMTHSPETLGPYDTLETAAERMADRRIGCLPIVDGGGRLVGILSETDLLRALATHLWSERLGERAAESSITTLVRELEREREAVAKDLAQLAGEDRRRTEERREPGDLAEHATLRSAEQLSEAFESAKARRLAALEHALERAKTGRLGICERCGGAIPVARLRALPGSTECIACARSHEAHA
jgi:CBS domain-containing protein/RNA polymerase-binding transcription factor DksA